MSLPSPNFTGNPAMTTEDQKAREEFEAWYIARQRSRGYGTMLTDAEFVGRHTNGRYSTLGLDDAFEAWQASRRTYRATVLEEAAQVCEDMHDEDRPSDYAYAIRALIPCAGTNCGATTGPHSAECIAEHARAVAGIPRDEK